MRQGATCPGSRAANAILAGLLWLATACASSTGAGGGGSSGTGGAAGATGAGGGQSSPLILPNDWAGHWEINVTSTGCESGALVAVDDYDGVVCPGERLAPGLSRVLDSCAVSKSLDTVVANCEESYSFADCTVSLGLELSVTRSEDAVFGGGSWTSQGEGACTDLVVNTCERINIQGARRDPDTSECSSGEASP